MQTKGVDMGVIQKNRVGTQRRLASLAVLFVLGSGCSSEGVSDSDRASSLEEAATPATPVAPSGQIAQGSVRILRTRLDCDALAVNQLGDPTHNDLVSDLAPDLSTPNILSDHFATRITGRRSAIALDRMPPPSFFS